MTLPSSSKPATAAAAAAREANVGYGYTPAPPSSSSSNRTSASTAAANQQAAQELLGAGYRNLAGDKNKSTLAQQFTSGIRNLMSGESLPGDNPLTAKPVTTDGPSTRLPPPQPEVEVDPFRPPPDLPPEIVDPFRPPVMPPVLPPYVTPQRPTYGGGGLGAFGYSPASMQYESQQGAGQVPYYMAAARNSMNPNMSPAFMNAARNYDILGGMQRIMPRPIEMMSARERAEIMNMGSNFNTPNYNSPYYQPSPQSEFDYFSNMVSGRRRAPLANIFQGKMPGRDFSFGGPGKGAPRPMPQDQRNRAMAGGLAALMNSGMFG